MSYASSYALSASGGVRGPSGVCSEESEKMLLEDWVRAMVSEGEEDKEECCGWGEGPGDGCGEGGGGRRDEEATGWGEGGAG